MTASQPYRQELVSEDQGLTGRLLEILRRPSNPAISLKEIARELGASSGPGQLEQCLLTLLEHGVAEPVLTSGYEVGFRARFPTKMQ